jgi:hypothetical protein
MKKSNKKLKENIINLLSINTPVKDYFVVPQNTTATTASQPVESHPSLTQGSP